MMIVWDVVFQALFGSDRHCFMSEAAVAAIRVHDLETERIYNDSTTVSFSKAYNHQSPEAVQLKFGHNRDSSRPIINATLSLIFGKKLLF